MASGGWVSGWAVLAPVVFWGWSHSICGTPGLPGHLAGGLLVWEGGLGPPCGIQGGCTAALRALQEVSARAEAQEALGEGAELRCPECTAIPATGKCPKYWEAECVNARVGKRWFYKWINGRISLFETIWFTNRSTDKILFFFAKSASSDRHDCGCLSHTSRNVPPFPESWKAVSSWTKVTLCFQQPLRKFKISEILKFALNSQFHQKIWKIYF